MINFTTKKKWSPLQAGFLIALLFAFISPEMNAQAGPNESKAEPMAYNQSSVDEALGIDEFVSSVALEKNIVYGQVYNLKNGFSNWKGGFLDVCGNSNCGPNKYNVSVGPSADRHNKSGSWKIVSADGKKNGTTVNNGDRVRFYNSSHTTGGYLDVCGTVECGQTLYAVSISPNGDRDGNNTSTWTIKAARPGPISENEEIWLQTKYNNWWLQTCGVESCGINKYDVNVWPSQTRTDNVTMWKMVSAGKKATMNSGGNSGGTMVKANSVVYGQKYNLMNGYDNWKSGFLDVCGNSNCGPNKYNVSVGPNPARNNKSGYWMIKSADGKANGTAVSSGDKIRFYNSSHGSGGYLDVCGTVECNQTLYAVSISPNGDRDGNNTSTWTIKAAKPGPIEINEEIWLQTKYNSWWLQTCGRESCGINEFDVNVWPSQTRQSSVTSWKIVKARTTAIKRGK